MILNEVIGPWCQNSIFRKRSFLAAGKPIALVCHAPGALRHVKTADGKPLVEGKNVTGFTNSEEEAVGLTKVVPFLVEDELKAKGGHFSKPRLGNGEFMLSAMAY